MNQEINTNIKLLSPYSVAKLIDRDSKTLTVMISGFGYSLDMPFFYYSQKILEAKNTDVLKIDFAYNKDSIFLNMYEGDQDKHFESDIKSIQIFLENTNYDKILFLGKSLGTTTIFNLLKSSFIKKITNGIIWITPASISKDLGGFLPSTCFKNLIIHGTSDKYSKDLDINKLNHEENIKLYPIFTDSHRLECIGLEDTINALNEIMISMQDFIDSIIN
jgi:hypothetical protein